MRRFAFSMLALAAALSIGPQAQAQAVIEIKMVDKSPTEFAFEPANVTVKRGDTIRWIYAGSLGQPHNVDFRGGGLAGTMSPFLMKEGNSYEITIDDRFQAGVQDFVFSPDVFICMKGRFTVDCGSPDLKLVVPAPRSGSRKE